MRWSYGARSNMNEDEALGKVISGINSIELRTENYNTSFLLHLHSPHVHKVSDCDAVSKFIRCKNYIL
jgi:hypothetical protein